MTTRPGQWLSIARGYIGTKESPGSTNNPQILEWFSDTGPNADWAKYDSIPWCAAFVNGVLEEAGLKGSGSLLARSFLTWGKKLDGPVPGCIVVFPRGKPPSGHVCIVESVDLDRGRITTIDGNVSDRVARRTRKINTALGFRWPAGVPVNTGVSPSSPPLSAPVLKKSRKWTILGWLKWVAGALGLGGLGVDLGSASGIAELQYWSSNAISLWQTWGLFGLVALCIIIVTVAAVVQSWMKEDVESGRYIPSGEDLNVD